MRDLETLIIKYVGYSIPQNDDEVELEILGLNLAIKNAEQRIALIKQGVMVSRLQKSANSKEQNDE